MKKVIPRVVAFLMVLFLTIGVLAPTSYADEVTDQEVSDVITMLNEIDTLQEMQNKRSEYRVNSRYNASTTDANIISAQEAKRTAYEGYLAQMFAKRDAAQQAYDALTADQQALIAPELVAKLDDELDTVVKLNTFSVVPRGTEYSFYTVGDKKVNAYEVSNHITGGPEIPATFLLVDTADGATSWTPNGLYIPGESNYEVVYCSDLDIGLDYDTYYKRVNLEDSGYYGTIASEHIRGILLNSYPYVSLDQMKENLKENGLSSDFVESLTRSDIIAAVQMAVWAYANSDSEDLAANLAYSATYDITANSANYMSPLHDYTNELWTYWTTNSGKTTFDARAQYRVNTLVYHLCNLPTVEATSDQTLLSEVEVTRASITPGPNDTYYVGMYIHLNAAGTQDDDLTVSATSYQTNEDGSESVTAKNAQSVDGRTEIKMTIKAKSGDTIKVVVDGTQYVSKGVYFYEPENGRESSQSLVGVGEGDTKVYAETDFTFEETIEEMGLRIYKTETDSSKPISDIVFDIYRVVLEDGDVIDAVPTEEELAKYKTEENKVVSLTTDSTGYASTPLEAGIYLVVEQHNADKVLAPVSPFYVHLPMKELVENEDGTTTEKITNIVSVYPKNEPTNPPPPPPPPPPYPEDVVGKFNILKYDADDATKVLSGATFAVYRLATKEDTETETITYKGAKYSMVPVMVDGEKLVLVTGEDGKAVSPDLTCGTYYLVETKAPRGYNLLEEAVAVTVTPNAMTNVPTVEIENTAGHILPQTGGMGTTMFLMVGGILVLGAFIFLVTRRRMCDYR